jgi:hypothetical protein
MQSQNANKTASGKKRNLDDLQIADLSGMHFRTARNYLTVANLVPKQGPGSHDENLATLTALLNGVYILNSNASKFTNKM